jgi:hypothetical protein
MSMVCTVVRRSIDASSESIDVLVDMRSKPCWKVERVVLPCRREPRLLRAGSRAVVIARPLAPRNALRALVPD